MNKQNALAAYSFVAEAAAFDWICKMISCAIHTNT